MCNTPENIFNYLCIDIIRQIFDSNYRFSNNMTITMDAMDGSTFLNYKLIKKEFYNGVLYTTKLQKKDFLNE